MNYALLFAGIVFFVIAGKEKVVNSKKVLNGTISMGCFSALLIPYMLHLLKKGFTEASIWWSMLTLLCLVSFIIFLWRYCVEKDKENAAA